MIYSRAFDGVELRWQNGIDADGEPAIIGRVRMSDVEFDYKAAIGAL